MIDFTKVSQEALDDWCDNEVTQFVVRSLIDYRFQTLAALEDKASLGEQPHRAAALAGETMAIRRLLETIRNAKGAP